uniref:Nicotinamide/nicotinic acid mononucleotide adenylyltransferase 2 n=1 Tax=Oryctolagus cuniculus TaxID=9986 RepID=A0A5F9CMP6_RABIT
MENRWVPALAPWRSDTGDSSRPSQSSGTRGRHRVDAGPSGAASPGVLEKTSFPPLPARVPEKPGAVRPSVPPRTPASPPQPRDRRACWAHDGCCRAMRRPGWDVSSPCPASFSVPHAALPRLSVPPPGNKGCGGCCGRLQACSVASQGLVSSRHRLVMCQLAVQNSDWIRVDPWECYQDTWQTTCSVLQHHRDLMKRVTGCILSNVSTPSMTPVIGQPQQETPQPAYQNSNVPAKPTADENANLGTVMRYEEIELRILLLCGSDLLESFCIPGLWNEADMEVIVGDFGIVVVPRDAADTDRIMNHSSILRKYRVRVRPGPAGHPGWGAGPGGAGQAWTCSLLSPQSNILVVKDDVNHPMSAVSSTKSRLALQHGDGHVVDYLSQPVIDYILKSQLYINASG